MFTLVIIISLILPLHFNTLKFANGENKMDSTLVMYNDNNSKNPVVLTDSENTILKPKVVEVSIEGTPNDDQLKGGDGDDKISGEGGDDTISGREGNDEISGGKNDDIINGESGNDTLKGGSGDDKINGEGGNDLIEGGTGNDTLLGGEGDDGILGNEGSDILNGDEGVDVMAGGLGNDTFICDQSDILVDFNLNEGDKTIGECSPQDLAQNGISYSDEDIPQQDLQSLPQPPLQSEPPPSSFNHDNISPEDFGIFPQFPILSSNEGYM